MKNRQGKNICFNYSLLKKDLFNNYTFIICIVLYILVGNLVIGKICPFRMIWGIPCPGCGMTRAFLLAVQGRFYAATIENPFWIAVVIGAICYIVFRYMIPQGAFKDKAAKVGKTVFYIVLAAWLIFYIYRMLVWFPDREPMVYDSESLWMLIRSMFTS